MKVSEFHTTKHPWYHPKTETKHTRAPLKIPPIHVHPGFVQLAGNKAGDCRTEGRVFEGAYEVFIPWRDIVGGATS